MNFVFPFSAVLGQESLKLALLLNAIDPALGGVLVTGPRGVAKTTLARALAELVPGRFVELPLGATEERVAGTLDLTVALDSGRVEFSPGLLARAHDGVLYVDEVNLLPDQLVDLLLDAAASGRNVVERDAVSHVHPARFVLVGTMNPEEGELRPQLIDRFGLIASAEGSIEPTARVEIVRRRLEFDRDPEAFVARFAGAQRELVERCARTRERAAGLPLSDVVLARVSERCHAAGVEGVRADLAMLRAARAHAAWLGQDEIGEANIDAVAELALAHRRRGGGGQGGGGQSAGGGRAGGGRAGGSAADGGRAAAGSREEAASARADEGLGRDASGPGRTRSVVTRSADDDVQTTTGGYGTEQGLGASVPAADGGGRDRGVAHPAADGGGGALPAIPTPAIGRTELPRWLYEPDRSARRRHAGQRVARGRRPGENRIDWVATLSGLRGFTPPWLVDRHGAPRVVGENAPPGGAVTIGSAGGDRPSAAASSTGPLVTKSAPARRRPLQSELRYRPRRRPDRQLWVVAIDCSASMSRGGALSAAKTVARAIHERALRLGAHIGLISFRGHGAVREASARAGRSAFTHALAGLGAGGGTPLGIAFREMLALAGAPEFRAQGVAKRFWLLTDGRSRETVDLPGLPADSELVVIDCERGRVRLGRARRLADAFGAVCLHVDTML
jgi:magnesium chelatase subunit I